MSQVIVKRPSNRPDLKAMTEVTFILYFCKSLKFFINKNEGRHLEIQLKNNKIKNKRDGSHSSGYSIW